MNITSGVAANMAGIWKDRIVTRNRTGTDILKEETFIMDKTETDIQKGGTVKSILIQVNVTEKDMTGRTGEMEGTGMT